MKNIISILVICSIVLLASLTYASPPSDYMMRYTYHHVKIIFNIDINTGIKADGIVGFCNRVFEQDEYLILEIIMENGYVFFIPNFAIEDIEAR